MVVHPSATLAPLAALLVIAGACGRRGGDDGAHGAGPIESPDSSADLVRHDPPAGGGAVVFSPIGAPEVRVSVEVARTARQIQRGLMYRQFLAPDSGMLFLMRRTKEQTFWMKNTLIPLDMIFVSADMMVVGVVENTEPQTLKSRTCGKPSQYVIEVNAGWTKEHGVIAGLPVRFEHVPPITAADGPYDEEDDD